MNDDDLRVAALLTGLVFCAIFLWMTIYVATQTGVDVFTLAAVGIVALFACGLIGALRNPPE